jgi:hypothetical protein
MIPDFAQTLYDRFEREGIPLLLAGGWAVCHHGYSRTTFDVDWVCPRSQKSAAASIMEELGFSKLSEGMASRFKNRKHPALPYIDLIWVDDVSFAKMAVPDSVGAAMTGVPAINFRSLLAMKLFALKNDEEREHKDLLDIRFLLKYGHTRISDEEFRAMCERYAGLGAYEKIKSS